MSKIKFKGERTASTIKIASGMVIFLAAVSLNFTTVATLIAAALSAMASYEFLKAFGTESKILFTLTCTVSAAFVCYIGYVTSGGERLAVFDFYLTAVILGFYTLLLLTLAVLFHEKIKYVHAISALFASIAIPYAFSCFIMLNNINYFAPSLSHYEGIYFVFMVFGTAWLTDVFAFLVGRKLGRHKLCPNISPKKSVEGAVGGVVIMALLVLFVTFVFDMVAKALDYEPFLNESNLKYLVVAGVAVVLSIFSMIGDLAASVLKRNVGIKDFSNLLPGHGGIIDRFDSCFFVLPLMFGTILLIVR